MTINYFIDGMCCVINHCIDDSGWQLIQFLTLFSFRLLVCLCNQTLINVCRTDYADMSCLNNNMTLSNLVAPPQNRQDNSRTFRHNSTVLYKQDRHAF